MTTNSIYIIRARRSRAGRNVVKIGRATSVTRRLEQLQTGSAERLELVHAQPAPAWVEPMLHQEYAPHRIRGEWFSLTDDDLARAIELIAGEVEPTRKRARVARARARRMATSRKATIERKRAAGILPADGRARCTPARVRQMTDEEIARMNHRP